jgi:hypothetical protein
MLGLGNHTSTGNRLGAVPPGGVQSWPLLVCR